MSALDIGIMATKTGGRAAATRHIAPRLALAVGKPSLAPPTDWQWRPLADLARLESGHTPSRRHPEYWGGDVPWISIPDAKVHHGGVIANTAEIGTIIVTKIEKKIAKTRRVVLGFAEPAQRRALL